ncbi:MAG: DUF928 domain-containing protein [Cyanobacteriota bacterium]|nr:DUF928 domain-containing protein [Cyanobacteriota bacterium]
MFNIAQSPTPKLLTRAAFARPAETATEKSLFALPVDSKPRRSQGSGARGCAQGDLSEVTLLIPSKEVVGQTVSARPAFFWQVSQPVSEPIKFAITHPDAIEPLYETQVKASEGGIVKVQLPADLPELVPGQPYAWTVSLICNERRPSANPFYSTWIERVPMETRLEDQLAAATSDRDRARIYAEAGAWYDALNLLYQAKEENPDDPQIQADWLALLAVVGFPEVASSNHVTSNQ